MNIVLAKITVHRAKPLAGADALYCDEKIGSIGVGGWVHPTTLDFIPLGGHLNRKNGILFMLLDIDPKTSTVLCRIELTGRAVELSLRKSVRVNIPLYGDFDLTLTDLLPRS